MRNFDYVIKHKARLLVYAHAVITLNFIFWAHYEIYKKFFWLAFPSLPIMTIPLPLVMPITLLFIFILPFVPIFYCDSSVKEILYSTLAHFFLSFLQCRAVPIILS